MTTPVRLALDWYINSVHIGIVVACRKNWLADLGISLELLSPEEDNYQVDTVQKLLEGRVEIALCPPELLIASHEKGNSDLIAVAALLQPQATGFAFRRASKPIAQYAALQLPYEASIVNQVSRYIGIEQVEWIQVDKLDTWRAYREETANLCWIFQPWEGVEMEVCQILGEYIPLHKTGVPYPNAPLVVCRQRWAKRNTSLLRGLLHAFGAGYYFARDHMHEAIAILAHLVPLPPPKRDKLISKSVIATNKLSMDVMESWGRVEVSLLRQYLHWLCDCNALTTRLEVERIATNEFLE